MDSYHERLKKKLAGILPEKLDINDGPTKMLLTLEYWKEKCKARDAEIESLKAQLAERDVLIAKKDEALTALIETKKYKDEIGKDLTYLNLS